jgi:hypothetical protein
MTLRDQCAAPPSPLPYTASSPPTRPAASKTAAERRDGASIAEDRGLGTDRLVDSDERPSASQLRHRPFKQEMPLQISADRALPVRTAVLGL